MKTTTLAIAAAMAAGTLTYAQEAVQWRVEDGGNGHWYQARSNILPLSWSDAAQACQLLAGHLATVTTPDEFTLVYELAGVAMS